MAQFPSGNSAEQYAPSQIIPERRIGVREGNPLTQHEKRRARVRVSLTAHGPRDGGAGASTRSQGTSERYRTVTYLYFDRVLAFNESLGWSAIRRQLPLLGSRSFTLHRV